MIHFESDYCEGAHPLILEALLRTNYEQTYGYGQDEHCKNAELLIQHACNKADMSVHFVVGGTQANMLVCDFLLKSYQAIVCAESGHINVHEAGAVESTGHKIITLPSNDGLLKASDLEFFLSELKNNSDSDHLAYPGMVYISFPSENGLLYTSRELDSIYNCCKKYNIFLFIDGARLGYGLAAKGNDVDLKFIANHSDVFYIGATKLGTLFGEAICFANNSLSYGFRNAMKQHGAMLAKGRLLGVQFETLFSNGLYQRISEMANYNADKIENAFREKGYTMWNSSQTNQRFVEISNSKLEILEQDFSFSHWAKLPDNKTVIRICTGWATKDENVKKLIDAIPFNLA